LYDALSAVLLLDLVFALMHDLCMAIKTISLELDAYEKLRRAKRTEKESFSSVVRRARWDDLPASNEELVRSLTSLVRNKPATILSESSLRRLEGRRRTVRSRSKWEE